MSKFNGYLRLMRPLNCFMMGLAVIVGAALAGPTRIGDALLSIMYGCITGFALTAASMAINDYYDRAIDAINEPKRPIPSGVIKPKEALAFASILTAIGFVTAYLTNTVYPLPLLTAIIAWGIFTAYTTIGKRSGLPGNLLVSACVAIPFIYGSVALTAGVELNVLLFASMAFLSNTGREVTKGIVDVEGDKTQNVKTLAVRYGDKKATAVAIVFFLSAVLLSPIPWLLDLVSVWFVPFVLVTDVGFAVSSFMLYRDHSREKARKIKNTVLLWFVFGLLAFVFGLLRWP
jgi:geranylgeranylglycerol-phosphate geranylgeranyltransferase